MGKFDLAAVLGDVSNLDTGGKAEGREQIEYIDITRIDPDPKNFYTIEGIEELAASIELLGLQQPLRVRDETGKPGHVAIVSGHRRRAALELLVSEGKSQYAQVPCIREAAAGSAALQELRLIYANSDTRKLTSAEISKQAERVEALLYQLKEEGMEFPGRMRDHVAEACNVSRSKLARLKVIRNKLDGSFAALWEQGIIPENTAYALAQQPVEIQRAVFDYKCTGKYGAKYLTEPAVKVFAGTYIAITEQQCEKCSSGKCEHAAALLRKIYDGGSSYTPCQYKCCTKCEKLARCKTACPKLADEITRLRANKKESARREKLAREIEERSDVEQITKLWARFGQARGAAKKSVRQVYKTADMYYTESDATKCCDLENGVAKISPSTELPYGYRVDLVTAKSLIAIADLFGCSLDYLFCRTDVPALSGGSAINSGAATWVEGAPTESGLYVMIVSCEGVEEGPDIYKYDAGTEAIYFPYIGSQAEDLVCLRYIRLPED